MRLSVLDLTLKLVKNRANVVCFVGKKIWDVYEAVAIKTAGPSVVVSPCPSTTTSAPPKGGVTEGLVKLEREDGDVPPLPPASPERGSKNGRRGVKPEPTDSSALDPPWTKIEPADTATNTPASSHVAAMSSRSRHVASPKFKTSLDWTQPRSLRLPHAKGYTYFWVTPSTSGLERTPVSLSQSSPDLTPTSYSHFILITPRLSFS